MNKLLLLWHYLRTKQTVRWSDREKLLRWQDIKVQRHVQAIRRTSPFYRELWGDLPASAWRQFPIIDKSMMMTHFDRLNTVGITKDAAFRIALEAEGSRDFSPMIGSVTVGLSSGTSGNRGIFLVSERERSAWAGTILAKVLPGSLLQAQRVAFFLRADSNLYNSVSSTRLQFAFYDLLVPLEQHIERLNRYQPTLLVGPPSMLRLLAAAQANGSLQIEPRKLISVAEVLDPLDSRFISAAFHGQVVHQIYQCTEGFLATTCEFGTLHLNEDVAAIEKQYLDTTLRKFVPIITDFSRTTQPIIRYRLNDILTESNQPCRCGSVFTALERIEGRCDDLFYFRTQDSSRLVPVFPDFISRAIIFSSPAIEEYRVIQHAPDSMEVSLVIDERLRPQMEREAIQAIRALADRLGAVPPSVVFTPYTRPERTAKLRRVERRFSLETDDRTL